jgi:hypothetical protein
MSDDLSAFPNIVHILRRGAHEYDFLQNAEEQNMSSVCNNIFTHGATFTKVEFNSYPLHGNRETSQAIQCPGERLG